MRQLSTDDAVDSGDDGRASRITIAAGTVSSGELLGKADMMMLSSVLMQFSDHSGITSNDLEVVPDFSSIAQLKDMFVARSAKDGCLNAVQQFDEALRFAGDDIRRALMLLWAASRQYARWLDSSILLNELTTKK